MGWQVWMNHILVEKFSNTRNQDLEAELGVSNRTLLRHARALGLVKSEEFLREAAARGLRHVEYIRLTEGRAGGFRKGDGHKGTSGSFRPGHRFGPEVEKKRVESIRETAWQERRRMMHGMARKTRWKMADYLEKIK